MIAFGFGLIHGFGFSFALRETLQFAGTHLLTSLLAFNFGIEIGQLLVLLAMLPVLMLLFRYTFAERMGVIILSVLVAHTGWHWMMDRADKLRQYRVGWPDLNAGAIALILRWLAIVVAAAGLAWFASLLLRRSRDPDKAQPRP